MTDAFELDADGFEGSVQLSESATEQMGLVSEIVERTRPGSHWGGWYHSHPFEVGAFPNYFLSNTDVITTRTLQGMYDRQGLAFVSLVVDPLTGAANGRPMIGAFRTFPDTFAPAADARGIKGPEGALGRPSSPLSLFQSCFIMPLPPPHHPLPLAGEVWEDKKALEERWGLSHGAYYSMEVSYFCNPSAAALMGPVMWAKVLSGAQALEAEVRDEVARRVQKAGAAAEGAARGAASAGKTLGARVQGERGDAAAAAALAVVAATGTAGHGAEAAAGSAAAAGELLRAQVLLLAKLHLFCGCREGGRAAPRGGEGGVDLARAAVALEVAAKQATHE